MLNRIELTLTFSQNANPIPRMFALLIILAVLGAAATVAGVAARRQKSLPGGRQQKLLPGGGDTLVERGFSDLRVGDIVQKLGSDFLVEGIAKYDEAGHRWSMAYIVDGSTAHWLLIGLEKAGSSAKQLLEPTDELSLSAYPSEVILIGEREYHFDKRGTATVSVFGNVNNLGGTSTQGSAHRCRWWSYSSAGNRSLIIEQWGDDYRVLVGKSVGDTDLEFLPGS